MRQRLSVKSILSHKVRVILKQQKPHRWASGRRRQKDLHDARIVNVRAQHLRELVERQRPIELALVPILFERSAPAGREVEAVQLQLLPRLRLRLLQLRLRQRQRRSW